MGDSYTSCLEPEVLAAYVDRGLSLAERARVDHHLALCPQCVALVAGIARTVADVPENMPHAGPAVETASRAVTRRTLVGVLAAAAAVIAILYSPSLVRSWREGDTGLVNLVGVSEYRSVLGRLTGGFPHAPLGVPPAGGQGGRAAETDRILLTAAKIRESFGERETPSRLHELGLSELLAGRHNEAAEALLAASREQPANARYLNDVAAVQLERARLGLRPDDLPRALASADRARRLDPSLTEAWFNRALAATALSLTDYATVAWNDYLARDGASPWAGEARARLSDLARPTPAAAWTAIEQRLGGAFDATLADDAVRTQMTEARHLIEEKLLPAWAAAVLAGRSGSDELDRVSVMASAFARLTGDALYVDAVSAIHRAEGRGAALGALAQAHTDYAAAAALHAEDRFSDAAPGLASSRTGLLAAGSPFADRVALDLATALYVGGKAAEATTLLDAASQIAETAGYAYNAARATWIKGLIAFGQSRLAEAQANYEQTLAGFERMGDVEQAAFVHNLLANLHFYLGDRSAEWHHRLLAINGLRATRSPRTRHAILGTTAASLRADNPATALTLQGAVLENARAWGRSAAIAEVLTQRAAVLLELGRGPEAGHDLANARAALASVADRQFRERLEVALLSTESDLLRLSSPAASVAAVTRAIDLVEQRGDRLRLAQLNLRLARSNIVRGNLAAADLALDRGIKAFEDERATLADEGRISTLDESWQLFDTAVHLAIRNRDYARAFALAERSRARTLAESRRPAARSLAEVESAMPANEAVIALNQFADELAVWVITRGGTTVFTRPLTRAEARQLIARQREEIRRESASPRASAALYNEVLRPAARQLTGVSRMVFVPDATFESASFAGLWDPSQNEFLAERATLSLSPTISTVAATSSAPTIPNADPLVLGGPAAGEEAIKVAAVYARAEVLTGAAATRANFLARSAARPVVHLAAQVNANRAYPLLSRVLLTDEPGQRHSGAVLGREIAAHAMPVTKLVVLDQSGSNGSNRDTGSLELSRAFMSAGVPAVLGTLAGADGPATRQLMVAFHQQMSTGVSAETALSTLQRNVLKSNGRRLGAWSALVLYGSDR